MEPLKVSELIPWDIIIEILSWLPVNSLLRFKCVRKQWCLLIGQDKKFIAKHMARASLMWLDTDDNFKVHGICDGLCLEESVTSPGNANWRIRNPATRQVISLPAPHERSHQMEFGFNSLTSECKVVNVYVVEEDGLHGVEIITVGTDDNWRPLKLPNQTLLIEEEGKDVFMVQRCFPVDNKGAVHFTETITNLDGWYLQVHSLDVESECYTTTVLPESAFLDLKKVKTFLWDGRPAVADIGEGALNVLVLEDWKVHRWNENKIIVPLKFLKDDPLLCDHDEIAILYASTYVFCFDIEAEHYWYDMRTKKFDKGALTQEETRNNGFVPSVVTLKGMRPEKDDMLTKV